MNPAQRAVCLLLCALLAACGVCRREDRPPRIEPGGARVYLLGQGWHAGLIIARDAGSPELWPERADFPDAAFIEIGWGERDFYQAEDPGVWLALAAALWPSRSVVFLSGLRSAPAEVHPCSDLIELALSPLQVDALLRYVHASFDRSGGKRVAPLPPGTSAGGRFYPARGRFHVFNTCNTWTAGAVAAAGLPIERPYPLTASGLVAEVRPWGKLIAPRAVCFATQYP